ncbi:MAG: efflux RND transporter periplasmic adaptor subunit [Sulfobacillus sp.]
MMKKWSKTGLVLIVIIVVLGAGYYVLRHRHTAPAASSTPPAYLTSRAQQGAFTGQVSASGSVQPSTLAVVQSPASATISTLSVQLNQTVAVGATIATLSSGQTLTSPIAGTVIGLPVTAGSYVTAGETLATIANTATLYANVQVPEQFVREVAAGQSASLTLPALPGQSFSGTVTKVGQQGTADSSGLVEYPATIKITNPSHILVGMSVAAVVTTGTTINTIYVPTAALVTLNGQFYVLEPGSNLSSRLKNFPGFGLSGFGGASGGGAGSSHHGFGLFSHGRPGFSAVATTVPVEVAVKIGLMNLSQTEIISGISAGQTVLIPNPAAAASGSGLGGGGFGGGFGRGG